MIEVIASDFARLETDTAAAEDQALEQYNKFMTDSSVDKVQKTTDIDHETAKKQNQAQELQEHNTDLEQTKKELDAAMDYFTKLKPSCVDAGESYEDRVARRKEEIESLQQPSAFSMARTSREIKTRFPGVVQSLSLIFTIM